MEQRQTGAPRALYFDGSSARGQPVTLQMDGGFVLAALEADARVLRWPLDQVQWPERTRHGQRVVQLRDGGALQALDAAEFDRWRRATGARESWVVRAQQNWRATTAAVAALLVLVVAGSLWGVPLGARAVLVAVPPSVDEAVGSRVLQSIEDRWLEPSRLPPARQAELRQAFTGLLRAAEPTVQHRFTLRFARADALGPNAFALPGGTIVMTDALVTLLEGHDDALMGVLAHEMGHVQQRHGMRALAQFALVGAATAALFGDFSSLLAAAPALVAQMSYSRQAEREADATAARLLRAAGRSPAAMLLFFEKLQAWRDKHPDRAGPNLPIALASHPADEERMRFFRDAAAGPAAGGLSKLRP